MLIVLLVGCPSSTPTTPIAPTPTDPASTPTPTPAPTDADGDGSSPPEDCDDTDATVFPGAPETWYDGIDSDCDGADDFDQDGDGARPPPDGGDCDDTDPTVLPILDWDPSDVCTCGNGLVEVGEACEPSADPSYTCTSDCSGPCGDGVPSADACLLLLASADLDDELVGLGDVDGDGRQDLLVQAYNPDVVVYLPYQANGSFGAPIALLSGRYAGVGDLDGDGTDDLVTTERDVGVTVHHLTAAGITSTFLGGHEGKAIIADYDGNGHPDVAVLEESGSFDSVSTEVFLHFQDTPGVFALRPPAITEFAGFESGYPAQIADRDGDGRAEAILRYSGFSDSGPLLLAFDNALNATPVQFLEPSFLIDLIDADLDGDGCLETVGPAYPTVSLFPCGTDRADASQAIPLVMPALDGTVAFAGDLLGTGIDELVVYQPDLQVLHRSTATTPYAAFPLGTLSIRSLDDLDGDGRDEIVSYDPISGQVEIHRWDP